MNTSNTSFDHNHNVNVIQTICKLEDVIDTLTEIYDTLTGEQYDKRSHYQIEYIYSLRSLTNEIKKSMSDDFCSLKYIDEKAGKLIICAEEFAKNDRD